MAIDESTERLNRVIRMTQSAFERMKLGVSAAVEMRTEDAQTRRFLSFCKDANEWRFMVNTVHQQQDLGTCPLLNASRGTRLDALKHFPALRDALRAEAKRQGDVIEGAVLEAEAFLDLLEPHHPGR